MPKKSKTSAGHDKGKPHDSVRSPLWPTVRRRHLQRDPACRACGTTDHLEVHHCVPFHIAPHRELDDTNLVTLCETPSHNCHLIWGHLLDWHDWNPEVLGDATGYRHKVANRKQG